MTLRVLFLTLVTVGLPAVAGVSCAVNSSPKTALTVAEYWQDLDAPSYLLGLEEHRLIVAYGGRVREVMGILRQDGEEIRLCYSGRETKALLKQEGDALSFHDPFRNQTRRLRKLPSKPSALSLTSFPLPDPSPVREEKVQEVQRELWRRSQQDQAALDAQRKVVPSQGGLPWLQNESRFELGTWDLRAEVRLADLTMKNSEFLRSLLLEVGWIDVERFGYGASNAAFLLLQHSWDVPMMVAVLPTLKKDVERGLMEADTYALLYDRLQLALGLRQRYGSQIARTPQGEAFVLPVEGGPAQVDTFRRQLGLIPLTDYLRVFGSSEVRFSSECQPGASAPRSSPPRLVQG